MHCDRRLRIDDRFFIRIGIVCVDGDQHLIISHRQQRAVRKRRKISQKALSEKSGVSLGSVKRFETSGEISLHALIKLAIALDMDDALIHLFEDAPFLSIEEILHGQD